MDEAILAGRLAILTVWCLALLSCSPCGDVTEQEVRSPNHRYVGTVTQRDCGATTDFTTIVSLRQSDAWLNSGGEAVFIVKGRSDITITWRENSTLQISCLDCAERNVFKKGDRWKDVQLTY